MATIILGFPVHEHFSAAIDLYHSIKQFVPQAEVIYSTSNGTGWPVAGLQPLTAHRSYRWGKIHTFLFDVIEQLSDKDYDYFVNLDSDCLFAHPGFDQIFSTEFEFTLDPNKINNPQWHQGQVFAQHLDWYQDILNQIGFERRDQDIVGSIYAVCIFSRSVFDFFRPLIPVIEASQGYQRFMALTDPLFCFDEVLIFNLLKDAGFKSRFIRPLPLDSIQLPAWTVTDLEHQAESDLKILYHKINRSPADPARQWLQEKIGLTQTYET